jgi:hypothetical protein
VRNALLAKSAAILAKALFPSSPAPLDGSVVFRIELSFGVKEPAFATIPAPV